MFLKRYIFFLLCLPCLAQAKNITVSHLTCEMQEGMFYERGSNGIFVGIGSVEQTFDAQIISLDKGGKGFQALITNRKYGHGEIVDR